MSEVASATGGRLDGPDVTVSGAAIDSRAVEPGALLVPLVAERDGHDFVAADVAGVAAGYLAERTFLDVGGSAVVVDDTGAALADLGRLARGRLGEGAH